MMDWQTLIALLIVFAAAGYVLQRGWKQYRGDGVSGCGGCPNRGGCSTQSQQPPVFQLQPPQQPRTR